MNKKDFIAHYIASFLASYAAVSYDMNCLAQNDKPFQPVEDAMRLAVQAWDELQTKLKA